MRRYILTPGELGLMLAIIIIAIVAVVGYNIYTTGTPNGEGYSYSTGTVNATDGDPYIVTPTIAARPTTNTLRCPEDSGVYVYQVYEPYHAEAVCVPFDDVLQGE